MAWPSVAIWLAGSCLLAAAAWWLASRRARRTGAARRAEIERLAGALQATEADRAVVEGRLAAIESLVGEALIYVGPEEVLTGASPSARDWFDLSDGAAPSLMAAVRSVALVDVVRAAQEGDAAPQSVRVGARVLRARAALMPDGGVVLALRDVTEVERLARARRDLVANVSHDLRTPLTAIGLLLETVMEQPLAQAEPAKGLVERIGEQVAVLRALAEGLVDLNRLESGQAHFRLEAAPLVELAQAAVELVRPQLQQQELAVAIEIPDGLRVLADRPHVTRLFVNLLDNAARYSPRGSTIAIVVDSPPAPGDERVEVCVVDHGPGIPPAELERVFERFYRSERSRTSRGAGLGLAIARHVVEGHGGTIRAEHAPGGGAELRFSLPLALDGHQTS